MASTLARNMKAILYLVELLYLTSFFGVLFVSPSFWLFGIFAFLLMFAYWIFRLGFSYREIKLRKIALIVAPTFVVCFITYWLLIGSSGGPDLNDLPTFAERQTYEFFRLGEVGRLRFVAASIAGTLSWHLLGAYFCLELIVAKSGSQGR